MEVERSGKFLTKEPPCCLRMNLVDPNIVYFGTYTLLEGSNRKGSIEIWDVSKSEHLKTHETHGAVLDVKLSPNFVNDMIMVTGHSTGNICIWKINENDYTDIKLLKDHQLFDEPNGDDETLITSVNFHQLESSKLVYTTTTGMVGILNLETGDNQILESLQHDLEAWYADFYQIPKFSNVVLSGGDDMQLIGHDIRQSMPIFQTKRVHDAGIVSILTPRHDWCPDNENRVWTGGYDDQLCVLDMRMGINEEEENSIWGMPPLVKEKHGLGGGVWRLIPGSENRVMTCNMYDGGRILKHDDNGLGVEVISQFKGDHESITYGGDWIGNKIVSCSFYDKVVQTWAV